MTTTSAAYPRRWLPLVPVALALVAVWWFAPRAPTAVPPMGHDHSQMPVVAAGPVSISAADARRIGVTFARAEMGSLAREVQLVGQVAADPARIRAVGLKVDGVVERLYTDYVGRSVQHGEPMLTIYSPMLVSAQEEMLVAQRLQASIRTGATDAVGEASDLAASARRRLEAWDIDAGEIAAVAQTGTVRRTLTLRAPATGVMVEKNIQAGQPVMAGQVVLRIGDLSQLWVEGDVYEQDIAAVHIGQAVRIDFPAWPNRRVSGRVVSFEPSLDPVTRTARVRVTVSNADGALRPGMYATLHLTGSTSGRTIVVPRGAVLATGERSLVFVRQTDGKLEPHEVTVGSANETQIQVLRGLTAGELVVSSATFLVDAESNLGAAMGGMGEMPGMDITTPKSMTSKKESTGISPNATMPDMPNMPSMPAKDHAMPAGNAAAPSKAKAVPPSAAGPAPTAAKPAPKATTRPAPSSTVNHKQPGGR